MRTGFVFLALSYVLSQFYRAFLAVLAPVLQQDINATAADLSLASGLWFVVFAAAQIPVGWALDRIGPRATAAGLLALGGGGGSALFALAQGPGQVQAAMALIGVGCAPVLMASFYIFARLHRPEVFGTLAGLVMGIGMAGNLAGSAPLALAVTEFGWRQSLWGLFAATLLVSAGLALFVRNPPRAERPEGAQGSLPELLRMRALWLILPLLLVNYAPAGAIRGLWAGPYLGEVFGLDAEGIGNVTFWMAVAMMLGSLGYGPLERLFHARKKVVLWGNLAGAACLFALWLLVDRSVAVSAVLLFGVGLFGLSYPLLMAHGRSFFPPHMVGRGVTLLNLFSVGGVGLLQLASGRIYAAALVPGDPVAPYRILFLFFALLLLAGSLIYMRSEERLD